MTTMTRRKNARSGISLLYGMLILFVLLAVGSLALDVGRVFLVKAQLKQAADAAALAAASGLNNKTTTQARNDAIDTANRNFAHYNNLKNDGFTTELRSQDVKVSKSKSSLPYNDTVEVTIRRPVRLMLATVLGASTFNVEVTSIARHDPGVKVEQWVRGTANPYLAGMPKGSMASLNNPHNSPDVAGDVTSSRPSDWKQSPLPVQSLPIIPGQELTFDEINGTTRHDPKLPFYSPDGETGENGTPKNIGTNTAGAENGISQLRAPINALVGVFLGPDRPDKTAPPPMLDYSTYESRHQERYTPQLKQIFFIGDGLAKKTVNGQEILVRQRFVVPEGATRLYLATWDFYEWNNNGGEREIRIERPARTYLIK